MSVRISVITPSYNQGRFIERTIQSVIAQQFTGKLEYFVIDGGSTDGTLDILRRYESQLHWISEKDRGQADAINKGLARAQGDIIGWLNSDDIYYPGAIAAACRVFDENPDTDVVYGDANHINEQDELIEPYPTEAWNFQRMLFTCFLCQPAVFFRKSVVDRCGMLNASLTYSLDYEYWIRLARKGMRFFWKRQILAGSRLHAETKTLGSRLRVHKEINDMLRDQLGVVPDRWLCNYAHVLLEEKGIVRSYPVGFALFVSMVSLAASIWWNRRISREMMKTTWTWTNSAVRGFLHGTQ